MASATRLPLKSVSYVAATTALVAGIGASRVNLRDFLLKTFTGPGSKSRIVAIVLILTNLKNVPFAWHASLPFPSTSTEADGPQFRVFNSILKHCLFSLPKIPPTLASSTLFLPVITTSHSPLYECDYNFHKSNSTYFSDLDVTRSHLICCLLQPGIDKLHHNAREKLVLEKDGKPVLGSWNIPLGGVMCSFKREIGMYQGFEMWSRLLCWDRKWIYIITHFVKKGTVRPSSYVLSNGSWFGGKGYQSLKGPAKDGDDVDEKAIYASAISKYVVKLGRLTVHPEVLLQASNMLPERPGGWHTMLGVSGESTPETLVEMKASKFDDKSSEMSDEWDWKRIVAENEKGLKYVEHFAALDGLHSEFTGSKKAALGKYRDFLL